MTREEMDAAIAAIDSYVERFPQELVTALWEARAWIEYGYESWHAMCEARGWTRRNVLTAPERRPVVEALRQEGMSIPAISAATGASVGTIHSDLSALKSAGSDLPDEVTSLDGRTRPATRPEVITAEEFVENYLSDDEVMAVLDQVVPERPEHFGDHLSTLAFRASFSRAIARAHGVTAFCAGEHVEKFDEEMRDELTSLIDSLRRRAEHIDAHLKAKTPRLRVIGEDQ